MQEPPCHRCPIRRSPISRRPRERAIAISIVFGSGARFPYAPERAYTPPEAPFERLLARHARLGFSRAVVVQGNAHGTDNRALLDALAREPQRLHAVATVREAASDAQLARLSRAGVRGRRFHHAPRRAGRSSELGIGAFAALTPRTVRLGLHAQFFMGARELPLLLERVPRRPLPLVLDPCGSVRAAEGVGAAGFQALLRHLAEGRIWVKLSAVYRVSRREPDYADAQPLHEALLAADPEQLVWGTGRLHPRLARDRPDTRELLDRFDAWTADGLRRKILVESPARLYGFRSGSASNGRGPRDEQDARSSARLARRVRLCARGGARARAIELSRAAGARGGRVASRRRGRSDRAHRCAKAR